MEYIEIKLCSLETKKEEVIHSLLSEKGELFSTPSRKSAMELLRTFKMFIWELDPKAALGSKRGRRKPKGFGS